MIGVLLALSLSSTIVDDLYGRRLLFGDDGRPLVPLGMMQGQKRVVVHAARGASGAVSVDVGDAHVDVAAGADIVIEWQSGMPGAVRALQIVETLEGEARGEKRARLEHWRQQGVDVRAYDVGGVYGVKGTVVDNRAVLLADRKSVV